MVNRSKLCEHGSSSGLTLVEVVVSLGLMGTLLVSALIGASSHLRQIRLADRKQAALLTIDRLLNSWSLYQFADAKLPECAEATGAILLNAAPSSSNATPTRQDFMLRLSIQPTTLASGYELETVRIEAVSTARGSDGTLLTWLEIVRPKSLRELSLRTGAAGP